MVGNPHTPMASRRARKTSSSLNESGALRLSWARACGCWSRCSFSLSRYWSAYRVLSVKSKSSTRSSNIRRKKSIGNFPAMSGTTPGVPLNVRCCKIIIIVFIMLFMTLQYLLSEREGWGWSVQQSVAHAEWLSAAWDGWGWSVQQSLAPAEWLSAACANGWGCRLPLAWGRGRGSSLSVATPSLGRATLEFRAGCPATALG